MSFTEMLDYNNLLYIYRKLSWKSGGVELISTTALGTVSGQSFTTTQARRSITGC